MQLFNEISEKSIVVKIQKVGVKMSALSLLCLMPYFVNQQDTFSNFLITNTPKPVLSKFFKKQF